MEKYDVVVIGAGPAGFGAALGAVKCGAKVLLVDKNSGPGGVSVYSGCPVFSGISEKDNPNYGGAIDLLVKKIAPNSTIVGCTLTTTEDCIQLGMSRILREAGVELLFYSTLIGANVSENKIQSVSLYCAGKIEIIESEFFVDATGNAELSLLANAKVHAATIDESMTKTLLFKVGGVTKFNKLDLQKRFQEKNFPFPWQNRFMGTTLGNSNQILLNLSAVAGDSLSIKDMTQMDILLREQIDVIVPWLQKEFEEFKNCKLLSIAPVIGTRVSRNIEGKTTITCDDLIKNTPVKEPIALGNRSFGEHYIKQFSSPWQKQLEGKRAIDYGTILSTNINNLAVGGRCISAESKAVSAIRLMPICISTGQAAGIAAALKFPKYENLKAELLSQKCKIV